MALNPNEILITLADQATTGAALAGDVLTTIPEDFAAAQTAIASFTATGYLSEDGIALSTSFSLSDFKEMNKGVVRKGIDEFTGTITYTELQLMNKDVLDRKFGAENVSITAATRDHGKYSHVSIGPKLAPIQSFAWKLKDGDARAILLAVRGQVTNGLDVTFAPNSMASVPVEVSTYDDGTGYNIHLYFDDGTVLSA